LGRLKSEIEITGSNVLCICSGRDVPPPTMGPRINDGDDGDDEEGGVEWERVGERLTNTYTHANNRTTIQIHTGNPFRFPFLMFCLGADFVTEGSIKGTSLFLVT
jgi:hypothetical protein